MIFIKNKKIFLLESINSTSNSKRKYYKNYFDEKKLQNLFKLEFNITLIFIYICIISKKKKIILQKLNYKNKYKNLFFFLLRLFL